MKGPHFFEKRKKEQARQAKLKEKAERKAQRKAEKGKEGGEGEPGDDDEFGDIEGVGAELQGEGLAEGSGVGGEEQVSVPGDTAQGDHAPLVSDPDGQIRGT